MFSSTQPLTVPPVNIAIASGRATVSFPSQTGYTYQVQWSANLANPWTNLHSPALAGNGSILSVPDPTTTTASGGKRFCRVVITGP